MSEHQQQHESSIAGLNKKIGDYEANIAQLERQIEEIESKISDCNTYLDLGKDSISTYWFAEKCNAFGVQQSYDNQIVEARKVALEIGGRHCER